MKITGSQVVDESKMQKDNDKRYLTDRFKNLKINRSDFYMCSRLLAAVISDCSMVDQRQLLLARDIRCCVGC